MSPAELARRIGTRGLIQLILIANAVMVLYPILMMFLSGFKSTRELFRNPFGLPEAWSVANFVAIWQQTNIPLYFRNSLIVTSGSIVLILILGVVLLVLSGGAEAV